MTDADIRDLNLSIAREVAASGAAHSEKLTEALREERDRVQLWKEMVLVALVVGVTAGASLGALL